MSVMEMVSGLRARFAQRRLAQKAEVEEQRPNWLGIVARAAAGETIPIEELEEVITSEHSAELIPRCPTSERHRAIRTTSKGNLCSCRCDDCGAEWVVARPMEPGGEFSIERFTADVEVMKRYLHLKAGVAQIAETELEIKERSELNERFKAEIAALREKSGDNFKKLSEAENKKQLLVNWKSLVVDVGIELCPDLAKEFRDLWREARAISSGETILSEAAARERQRAIAQRTAEITQIVENLV